MQAIEAFKTSRRLELAAANQEFANKIRVQAIRPAVIVMGWDPHEVWQRMIKEPRERRENLHD
jgi:hypothetical protein